LIITIILPLLILILNLNLGLLINFLLILLEPYFIIIKVMIRVLFPVILMGVLFEGALPS
jgi:hypothetical protein